MSQVMLWRRFSNSISFILWPFCCRVWIEESRERAAEWIWATEGNMHFARRRSFTEN